MTATPPNRPLTPSTLAAFFAATVLALMLAFAPSASADKPECNNPWDPGCEEIPGDGGGGEPTYGVFSIQSSTSPAATSSNPAWDDENLTYNVTVTNTDRVEAALGTKVTSTVEEGGATVVSATASQGSCSGTGPVTCELGTIEGDMYATVTIVVKPAGRRLVSKMRVSSNTVRSASMTESSFFRPAGASAAIDWAMPERSRDDNGDGLIDPGAPAGGYTPSSWAVDLDACNSTGGRKGISSYKWEIAGMPDVTTPNCSHRAQFPSERRYPAKLTLNLTDGSTVTTTRDIRVQDRLVVMMGDSYASGEGNPHSPIRYGSSSVIAPPTWDDVRCHRSMYAGSARAARILEQEDSRSSVTYVSRACSGATIAEGIIGSYKGVEPVGDTTVPPQVDQVEALVGKGQIDDLLLSIGGNDVGFAPILADCLQPGFNCYENVDLVNGFHSAIGGLKGQHYPAMRSAIESKLKPKTTYLTEYPDFTTGANGGRCNEIGEDLIILATMNRAEADWAAKTVLPNINGAVQDGVDQAKAEGLDWRYVGGVVAEWTGSGYGHGYCTGNPKQRDNNRWVRTFTDSCDLQGPPAGFVFGFYNCDPLETKGHFHPNEEGHMAYARRYLEQMRGNPPKIDETAPGTGGGPGGGDEPGDGGPDEPGDGGTGNPGGGPLKPLPGSKPARNPLAALPPVVGGTPARGGTLGKRRASKAGRCSKLRGRKRSRCVKRACKRYRGKSQKAKVRFATCKRAAVRKRR